MFAQALLLMHNQYGKGSFVAAWATRSCHVQGDWMSPPGQIRLHLLRLRTTLKTSITTPAIMRGPPICISWNAGSCRFPETCSCRHVCSSCGAFGHHTLQCCRTPPSLKGPQPNLPSSPRQDRYSWHGGGQDRPSSWEPPKLPLTHMPCLFAFSFPQP